MIRISTIILFCFLLMQGYAQEDNTNAPIERVIKNLEAIRISTQIKIDGTLNEAAWDKAGIGTDFIQRSPDQGAPATQKSEVKVLYDNTAIYVGGKLYDDPSLIANQLTSRDGLSNADWFGILLSPYKDGTNGNGFIMTSAGVQFDTKYSADGEDTNWDAVWEGETTLVDDGWIVEMRIPYSAIRFPKVDDQIWDLNFARNINREGESSFWNPIDRTVNGFLTQFGKLKGIKNIKPPVRLQATPFIVGYLENYNDKAEVDPQNAWGRSFNAGMDIKYGLSDAFTLDMTLIPDFGEAQSDNQVLNLTQFEVRFDENRQFFTEGTELFNKGGLFYSRRLGGSPRLYAEDFLEEGEEIIEEPQNVQLLNATKISGRTKKGTGIGFFNAVSAATNATIKQTDGNTRTLETNPLTNYNIVVVDQNLKNNSSATIINTNVLRAGSDYDANVTGAGFSLKNKKQTYEISSSGFLSQLYFANNENYSDHVQNNLYITSDQEEDLLSDSKKKSLLGHKLNVEFEKISGKFQYGLEYFRESYTWDINDLGFLRAPNEQSYSADASYEVYKPFGMWNAMGGGAYVSYNTLHKPNKFTELGVNAWWWGQTKQFWNFNIWTYMEPQNANDYFEPRTAGRFYKQQKFSNFGMNINSDRRKKLRVGFGGNYGFNWDLFDSSFGGVYWNINYVASDKWNIGLNSNIFADKVDVGFVTDYVNGFDNDEIILGKRDQVTVINTLTSGYNFNRNMNLTFRLRHYWSLVEYISFHNLEEDGLLGPTDYNEFNDLSFNFWNIDMIYRWRFAPGSDIFLIWKNSLSDVSEETQYIQYSYGKGLKQLDTFPSSNSISLKIVYFLDYLNFVKSGSEKRVM